MAPCCCGNNPPTLILTEEVNRDGVLNIFDLILIAIAFGNTTTPPALISNIEMSVLMLGISATVSTYLKSRRRGLFPRSQRVHRNCTPFLHEPS